MYLVYVDPQMEHSSGNFPTKVAIECDFCGKTFRTGGHLRLLIEKTHGGRIV